MIGKPRNLTVYLDHDNKADWTLLYAGPETKVNDFVRMWSQFRPLSTIQIRYLNSMDGITVMYQGEAGAYIKSRR